MRKKQKERNPKKNSLIIIIIITTVLDKGLFLAKLKLQNFTMDALITVLETRGTNCPDKLIPSAEEKHHEASPDILKGSCLIWVSASTNREERNDTGKRWRWRQRRGNQSGGMETLSKVNEQKDNVLAPNTTLSLSGNPSRRIMEGVGCQDSEVYGCVSACVCLALNKLVHVCFGVGNTYTDLTIKWSNYLLAVDSWRKTQCSH